MLPLTLFYVFSSLLSSVLAGSTQAGGACSQLDNHLQVGTYEFDSDCDSTSFCNSSGICAPKGCRRDIFPFGYTEDDPNLPPLCPNGQFCPDEEDACQAVLPFGSQCQLNRDDECEAPPNFKDLISTTPGLNYNGSVCLNFQCYFANVTLGLQCVVENTAYIAYGPDNQENIDIVSRGNCKVGLYCDSQQLVCMQTKELGVACTADKECASDNCLSTQVCGTPINAAKHFSIWVYVVVGVGIFGGMFGTLTGLFFLHGKHRDADREKRIQYWREQNAFRQNILQLRDTARVSLLSLPLGNGSNSGQSTVGLTSEDSQLPMLLNQGPKGSGLRHHFSEESERLDYDDIVKPRGEDGPRFRSARAF